MKIYQVNRLMDKKHLINYHGYTIYENRATGHGPHFLNLLMYRIHHKMATNVVVTGEAGVGKSYMATDLARVLEGKDKKGKDRFTVDQIVFTYKEFMDLVIKLKSSKVIVFDEPSYAMGKREWYRQLNKALVQTIESFRFKLHPLFIPIINKSLLDKTIRDHLIQYMVLVHGRGRATVYRVRASQFDEKTYHSFVCEEKHALFDHKLCDRDSCLDCPRLMQKASQDFVCNIFRARYERKKASIQDARYSQALAQAERIEAKQLSMTQIENLSLTIKEMFIKKGKLDVQAMRIALVDEYGVSLPNTRAYELRAMLLKHHPEILET